MPPDTPRSEPAQARPPAGSRLLLLAIVGVALGVALGLSMVRGGNRGPRPLAAENGLSLPRQRGVCFVAGPARVTVADVDSLSAHHVAWISLTPFGWQERADEPTFSIVTGGRIYWGETDSGLVATARLARERGRIRTLLKPHLWLSDRRNGRWVGSIAMTSEADWGRWFARYEEFIVHYARLAEAAGMDAFAIGTELEGTTARETDWRRIITAVRRVYRGHITYAANWSGEFERIAFWDALDFIGVQAYFPISDRAEASVEELVAGWASPLARIAAVQRRFDRPVVFTEIGYKAADRATVEPWTWRTEDHWNPDEQARAYEAAFRVLWDEPWCAGAYWWKWFPEGHPEALGRDRYFTPQGKPAAAVLAKWYGAGGIRAGPTAR